MTWCSPFWSSAVWDDPKLLSTLANGLFALAAVLLVYAVVAVAIGLPVFALRELKVEGKAGHVTREQVQDVVRKAVKGNFFTVDLAAVGRAFERLPWVKTAQVRRVWPLALEVDLREHQVLARWNDSALVDTEGEVFEAAYDGTLPVFSGPPGTALEVTARYRVFKRYLGEIGLDPVEVDLTPRGAWRIRTQDGMAIELGREQVEERLARFVAVYGASVGAMKQPAAYVDLRYSNGFAVRLLGPKAQVPGRRQGRDAAVAPGKQVTRGPVSIRRGKAA